MSKFCPNDVRVLEFSTMSASRMMYGVLEASNDVRSVEFSNEFKLE
jgi:hypothetical protein